MSRMIPYRSIESAEDVQSPLSTDMQNALQLWAEMYCDKAPWVNDKVHSLNLASLICSEISRQVLLEHKWNITGVSDPESEEVDVPTNPRAEYLKTEYKRLADVLRQKLEQGCAAGGFIVKPYVRNKHIYFDFNMAWDFLPVTFDDDGGLQDVIFRDFFQEGKKIYTRLERHRMVPDGIEVTQRAFVSNVPEALGEEITLDSVERWKELEPVIILHNTDGQMFGYFRVPTANNVDIEGPMGMSVFHRASNAIRRADEQWSRLEWEYEGTELAVHVDPNVFKPKKGADGVECAKLSDRLYRKIDLGQDDTYEVFSPQIRDENLIRGLNRCYMQIEDLCGFARGTFSDLNAEARTATELKIMKNRTYSTINDVQTELEKCLHEVVRVMNWYTSFYSLAPEGEYEASFEWDDSIITDSTQQLSERLELLSQGIVSRADIRMFYFGETRAQAKKAIAEIDSERMQQNLEQMLQQQRVENGGGDGSDEEPEKDDGEPVQPE